MVFQLGGFIYIMTNVSRNVLYTGVTSALTARVWQHKNKVHPFSFTAKYNVCLLVYYQSYFTIQEAISAEKKIKAGSRKKKIELIDSMNPDWIDLYDSLLSD